MLCNGDEGDPGAFMDRSILEGDPHSVLEGLIIGAKAIGAHKGFFFISVMNTVLPSRICNRPSTMREHTVLSEKKSWAAILILIVKS